jgi:hypothetical protein
MLRQLDRRNSAGMTTTLEWDSETGRVLVRCEHEHAVDQPLLCYPVAPPDARCSFLHPFVATPLDEPRLSQSDQAPTPGSDRAADLQATDETENTDARHQRWYHRRPILRPPYRSDGT